MLQGKYKVQENELLKLLNSRKAWDLPDYRRPVLSEQYRARIAHAARCLAEVNNSDPFIAARCTLHMIQGYDTPSDVLKDCSTRRAIMQKRKATEAFKGIEPLKRKLDEDRAWNQFHSKQYQEAAE